MIDQGEMASFRFGGGTSGTVLHPLVAVGMLIAIVMILSQPRNKAITPFLLAYFTIPAGQLVVLAGLHFTALQILILAVLARTAIFGRSSSQGIFANGFNPLDKVVVLWSLLELIAFVIQWMEMQALIKASGDLVVHLGGYLAARFLIPDRETLRRTVRVLAAVCVIQGVCMVSELFTYQNVFVSMGAHSPTIREGHVRAEGTMGGLYGGAFAGFSISLFLTLWSETEVPDCSMRRVCRRYGHGVGIPHEHSVAGLRRKPGWTELVASAKEDAACTLGHCGHFGEFAHCHAWTRLVPH